MHNNGLYPEIINNFHLYEGADNGGNMLLGISGQVELPSLEAVTETLSGSGILGEVEVTNPGHFSALDVTIPYVAVCEGMFSMDPTKRTLLTLRACEQSTVKATGDARYDSLKIVFGGKVKSYKLGKLENGKQMESSVGLSCSYIKISDEKTTLLELDKYNEVFVVNGVDMLSEIKSKC